MSKKNKQSNFEHDMKELQGIVDWFESEDVNIEESLTKFERGAELSKSLKEQLKQVENKVQKIKLDFGIDPAADSES